MGEKNKDCDVVYSVDGVNYKPLSSVSEVEIASADLAESDDICWEGKCSGTIKLKKRHQSRKWKKKHYLLRRQQRRLTKDLRKALDKTIGAAIRLAENINKLSEGFKNNAWFGTNHEKEEGTDDENKM